MRFQRNQVRAVAGYFGSPSYFPMIKGMKGGENMDSNKEYIDILISGLSAQTGIKLIPGKQWKANQTKKELTYNQEDLKNLPFDVVRGLMLHEMGHILYSPSFKESDAVKKYGAEMMSSIYNTFEDMRIERRLTLRFGSYARCGLDSVDVWGVEQHLFNNGGRYDELSKVEQFLILSLFRFYAQYVTDYSVGQYLGPDAEYLWSPDKWTYPIATFDKKVKSKHKAKRKIISQIIYHCYQAVTVEELQKIVDDDLIPIIKDFIEDKEDKKKGKGKKQQQGQQQQGQQQGKSEPKIGKGEGKPQKGDDEGKDGKPIKGEGDTKIEMVKGGSKGFSTNPSKKMERRKITKPTEMEARALLRPISYVFSQKLKDVLKEQKAIRFTGNYKSGKLLNKNAYKVAIGGETRIFSKRNNPDTPEYAVYIALDSSGSMCGEKSTYAFLGAALLKDVCTRLNFPVKVYEYDTEIRELKNLDGYTDAGGGTNDSVVMRQLDKDVNSSENSLVFIITDGETGRDDDFNILKKKLKQKNVVTFGVGIGAEYMRDSLKRNYDNAVCVEKVEELPFQLLTLMRTIIHR